jgi:hypothetical protein
LATLATSYSSDLHQVVAGQRAEDDHIVEAVDELGRKNRSISFISISFIFS